MALNNNDPVTSWADSSGNGRTLTQGTADKQPILIESGLNGRDIVRFGAVNTDSLQSGAFALVQPEHLFMVVKWRAGSLDNQFAIDGNGIAGMALLQPPATTRVDAFAGISLVGPAGADAWHQYAVVFNGASSEIRQDGGAAISGNASTNNAAGITLGTAGDGASAFAQCDIAEVIVYPSILSAANRLSVETYLRTRWATP